MGSRYRSEEWLKEKYVADGMSTYEIADMCGVDQSTISNWINKFGIASRPRGGSDSEGEVTYSVTSKGYGVIRWAGHEVRVHRLSAVAWFGWDSVVGKHIHHESGHPLDNRESVLRPVTPAEHNRIHKTAEHSGRDYMDENWLREKYVTEKRSTYMIADECDVSESTINKWLDTFDIGRRSRSEAARIQRSR